MIEIYTDGACIGNPGPGGWAAIVVVDGDDAEKQSLSGGHMQTTNNRMEINAVVEGLKSVPEKSNVTVFSDSQYVVNTMTRSWKRNTNKDLWEDLDREVTSRSVSWKWVRGHNGHPLNEMADRLAVREAKSMSKDGRPDNKLTHVDDSGKAGMVDVGSKPDTDRIAVAKGSVAMKEETFSLVQTNGFEKGDVIGVARIAGIMGAKNTAQLIPLCHPLSLNHITVEFEFNQEQCIIDITATASTNGKTGVEMEALTAVSIAALTIYDMCKSVDKTMRIEGVRLVEKSGGLSGDVRLK